MVLVITFIDVAFEDGDSETVLESTQCHPCKHHDYICVNVIRYITFTFFNLSTSRIML